MSRETNVPHTGYACYLICLLPERAMSHPAVTRCDPLAPYILQADVLPSVHGSGIFTRGETQSIATVALGPALDSGPRR